MKPHRKAWNGGSREAALLASRRRTEEAIASGCERCPSCRGEGSPDGVTICRVCNAAGFLVPQGGMPCASLRVRGVGRVSDEPRALLLMLSDVPTDDDLRSLHDFVRDWRAA